VICNCIIKRREAALKEGDKGPKDSNFNAGQNMADSESDDIGPEEQRRSRKPPIVQPHGQSNNGLRASSDLRRMESGSDEEEDQLESFTDSN